MIADSPYAVLGSPHGRILLDALAEFDETHAAAAAQRARTLAPPNVAAAALATVFARRRARRSGKFDRPDVMLFTRAGYEQASSSTVARHRGARFGGLTNVFDLCCGIGSDTIALAGQLTAQYVDTAKRPWGPATPSMRFEGLARVVPSGGNVIADAGSLVIAGADSVTAVIVAATDYLPDGTLGPRVPETILWYVEGEEFLGSISVRHGLTPMLELWGGHIGYAVRPSAWGSGHASAMLAGILDYVRANLPLERVTLTANSQNLPSIRVIEKNGGILLDTVPHPWVEGDQGHRYRIELR